MYFWNIRLSGCCLIDRDVAAKKCPISWNLNSLTTRDRIRNLLSEGQLWVAKLSLFQRQLFFINSTAQLRLAKLLLLGIFVNLNKNFELWANKQRQLYLQIWNKFDYIHVNKQLIFLCVVNNCPHNKSRTVTIYKILNIIKLPPYLK